MKRSAAILGGLLLAATLVQAAPRTTPARRPGILGWLFGRRQVVEVHHPRRAGRRQAHRHQLEGRHDRGRHLGWSVGKHKGRNRQGKRAGREQCEEHGERRGGGRGRNR